MPSSNSFTHPRRRLPLIALFTAQAVSLVGNVFSNIAIPWFVLQSTGSAMQTGITGFFSILPVVLAGFMGGALIDRLGYKRTSILADIASGITTALIPFLYLTTGIQFWQLMVLVFFGALFDAPGSTGRSALLSDLAREAGMSIDRATSISSVIERSSRLVGAPLAGLLVSLMGSANVLWLNAATFAFSALVISFLVPASKQPPPPKEAHSGGYFTELLSGWRYLLGDKLLLAIVFVVMLTNFFGVALGGVFMPVYVNRIFGSSVYLGLLLAANGGGAALGSLVYAAYHRRLPRYNLFLFGFVLTSLISWVFVVGAPLPALLLVTFIASIGAGPLNPIIDAVSFEHIPPNLRGRVLGTITAAAWVAMPLGMLVGGASIEAIGLVPALVAQGCVYLLATISIGFIPVMKTMNSKPSAG